MYAMWFTSPYDLKLENVDPHLLGICFIPAQSLEKHVFRPRFASARVCFMREDLGRKTSGPGAICRL